MLAQPFAVSTWWDPRRFIKTLSYFGVIPFLSDQEWFQQLLGNQVSPREAHPPTLARGSVLLLGAEGRLGDRLAAKLQERHYTVLWQLPVTTAALQAVIDCRTATAALSLNDPARAIAPLSDLKPLLQPAGQVIFDFSQPDTNLESIWGALDDVVMGGVSESRMVASEGAVLFTGTVSTANSGGFASVRTRNFEPPLNLAGAAGLQLRLRGDGQRYKLLLRSESAWDGVAYAYSFDTPANQWITVEIPFSEMSPVFRARTVTAQPIDNSKIYAIQLMLSKFEYDGALNPQFSPGPFHLQLASIGVYAPQKLPQFVGVNVCPAVAQWVRASGLIYTLIHTGTLTEGRGGQSLTLEPGAEASGCVDLEDLAEMVVRSLAAPQAAQVTVAIAAATGICPPGDWECVFSRLRPD